MDLLLRPSGFGTGRGAGGEELAPGGLYSGLRWGEPSSGESRKVRGRGVLRAGEVIGTVRKGNGRGRASQHTAVTEDGRSLLEGKTSSPPDPQD